MKKLLRYIFIPILAVMLMSHNVGAVNLVLDVSNYEHFRVASYPKISCKFGGADVVTTSYANTCPIVPTQSSTTDTWLYEITTEQSWQFLKNDLVNFKIYVSSNGLDGLSRVKPYLNYMGKDDSIFHVVSFTVMYDQVPVEDLSSTVTPSGGAYSVIYENLAKYVTVYDVTLSVAKDYTGPIYLVGNNNRYYNLFTIPTSYPVLPGNNFVFSTGNFFIYRPTEQAVNKEQEQKTQDASDNSATTADGNSSSQATSNLLGVFGSFVTALTSISPSNCNVDFDLGHIDFGVQNLCSQPVPQAFTVVTSIIVVCFTIPFVVHLIKRILSLIREMQT